MQRSNNVEKGMWDSLFRVYVIPDQDIRVTLEGSHWPKLWVCLALAALIIAAAAALMIRNLN